MKDDGEKAALECRVEVYNINWGHNSGLLDQCRKLYEYSYLVKEVRANVAQGLVLAAAIDRAVEACIKNGILKEFLLKHRTEVNQMILTEYNEALHIRNERELAMKEGIKAFILDKLEDSVPTERILERLQKYFKLDHEAAAQYLKQYSDSASE